VQLAQKLQAGCGLPFRQQHLASLDRLVELGLVTQLPLHLEVLGVLNGGEDRAADVARFLQQHRGRQIARRVEMTLFWNFRSVLKTVPLR
jgi:hypothetical protein